MTKKTARDKLPQGIDRRRAKRTEVLSTFSLFVVVPKKGPYRLPVHDVSEFGVGFDLDIEEEGTPFPVEMDDEFQLHLYLNQSLYLPLAVTVRRLQVSKKGVRIAGAEFVPRQIQVQTALQAFLKMLEAVSEGGIVV